MAYIPAQRSGLDFEKTCTFPLLHMYYSVKLTPIELRCVVNYRQHCSNLCTYLCYVLSRSSVHAFFGRCRCGSRIVHAVRLHSAGMLKC